MLTILTLKILLMIVYLSHWDWNLYKSRKDIISNINDKSFVAICPEGEYSENLLKIYNEYLNWNFKREKLFDIKGIKNLISILNKLDEGSIVHSFTLKTGIIFSIANLFAKNKIIGILSINGLGYLFSKNIKAKILKSILKLFISKLFNKGFKTIIFQNLDDQKVFTKYSRFKGKTNLIEGSGIETKNFIKKENYSPNNLKVIFVSRFLRDKGVENYLALASKNNNPNIYFYIAGDIDLGNPNSLTKLDLEKIKSNNNVEYVGNIDVEKELHNYDISVIMSKYEGFSRILLESLYVGLFCLSNDLPGTQFLTKFKNGEIIKDNNENEFLEIINNFDNYNYTKSNAEENRGLIKNKFSTIEISKKYNEIYNNLKKDEK